ncbi:MAG: LeoA/HP0731 family dynamin-like GTPase [Bacillus sp. (in: firmicutes)]
MDSLLYKKNLQSIDEICSKVLNTLEGRQEDEIKSLYRDYKVFLNDYNRETKLSIAFVGQYNAGKSSTIAALTNASFLEKHYEEIDGERKLVEVYEVGDKKLYVGAQIMTDRTEEYMWNDVRIIDTPGIYAGRNDHDEKTLNQISKTDLLVFVVSNELFNPQGGDFFRRIIHDMQRNGQVVLVVNKMSRESGTSYTLQKSLLEVMEPFHPDDFYTCYIDAHDYLEARLEEDDEERECLLEDSNFEAFLNSLQQLIDKNKLTARLLTPLHRASEVLEKAYNLLTTEEKLHRDMVEILRRKGILVRNAMTRFKNITTSELNKLEHKVIMIGENVAGMADGNHSSEEVNSALKKAESQIESESEQTLERIQNGLTEQVEQLQIELENLQDSTLGRSISKMLEASTGRKSLGERDFTEKKSGHSILEKGPEALNKVGQFATNVSKDAVYNFVKFFGGKFKPWGATKLTKFVNKLGPVLSIIGTVLDIFFAAKEEYDEVSHEQKLREARADLRKDFREVALEIRNEYEQNINGSILPFFLEQIRDAEKDQVELRDFELSKESSVHGMGQLMIQVKKTLTELTNR